MAGPTTKQACEAGIQCVELRLNRGHILPSISEAVNRIGFALRDRHRRGFPFVYLRSELINRHG